MFIDARAVLAHVPQPGRTPPAPETPDWTPPAPETPGWTPPAPEMPDGPSTVPGPEIEQPRGPDVPDIPQPEMPSIDPSPALPPSPAGPTITGQAAGRVTGTATIPGFQSSTAPAPTRLNA